jgi:hypothetical protein
MSMEASTAALRRFARGYSFSNDVDRATRLAVELWPTRKRKRPTDRRPFSLAFAG